MACLREEVKTRDDVTLPDLPVLKWFERGRLGGLTSVGAAEKRRKYIHDFCQEVLQLPVDIVSGRTLESFFETWNSDFNQDQDINQSVAELGVRQGLDFLRKLSLPEAEIGRHRTLQDSGGQRLFPLKRHTHVQAYHGDHGDIMGNVSDCVGSDKKGSSSSDSGSGSENCPLRKQGSIESFGRADLQYRVVSDFTKRKPGEVSLVEGSIVDVLETDLSGWWFVHVEDTQKQGWAPGAYLEPLQVGSSKDDPVSEVTDSPVVGCYKTTVAYKGQRQDELSYSQGQEVQVLEASMDGWWKVRCGNQTGFIPATHLEEISRPSANSKNQKSLLGGGLYHQQTIYKKKSPPPRRAATLGKTKSLDRVIEAPPDSPTDTDMAEKINRDKAIRKQVIRQKKTHHYTEIDFVDDDNNERKPVIRGDPSTEYADIRMGEVGEIPPDYSDEDDDEQIKSVPTRPEPTHNYINVNIPPNKHPYMNVNIPVKLEEKESMLYECIEDYTPHTTHIQGLPLRKGDIVRVEKEEGGRYLCVKCALNKDSSPQEGWVVKEALRKTQADISGKTRHSIPIVQPPEPALSKRPPPLNLQDEVDNGPAHAETISLPPMPNLPSPTPPGLVSRQEASPGSISKQIKALFDYSAPKETQRTILSFKKNEEGALMSQSLSGWWCVRVGGKVGWVPGDYWQILEVAPPVQPTKSCKSSTSSLDQDSPLYSPVIHTSHVNEPWFAGRMGRQDCEQTMKTCNKNGSFMVREGTHLSGTYTLSVHYQGKVRHFVIKHTTNGRYNIGKYDFKSLTKVVKYYQMHPLFYEAEKAISLTDAVSVAKD